MINGNMVGGGSGFGKTFIIEDVNGNEFTGVVVEKQEVFTATDNDVREGMVYASDSGVSTGTKNIPSYNTFEGTKLVTNGSEFIIYLSYYEYTKLQAIICEYNTTLSDSVYSDKVVINDNVYNVQSTSSLSSVTIDKENKAIKLGITNTSGKPCLIRYFTYKEMY
jgi:hypothetical protein